MPPKPWKTLASQPIYANKWMRLREDLAELPDIELDGSVIKQVHAVSGQYDLIAFVEGPDLQSLGN